MSDQDKIDFFNNVLFTIHNCRWTGKDIKINRIFDLITIYSNNVIKSETEGEEHSDIHLLEFKNNFDKLIQTN